MRIQLGTSSSPIEGGTSAPKHQSSTYIQEEKREWSHPTGRPLTILEKGMGPTSPTADTFLQETHAIKASSNGPLSPKEAQSSFYFKIVTISFEICYPTFALCPNFAPVPFEFEGKPLYEITYR